MASLNTQTQPGWKLQSEYQQVLCYICEMVAARKKNVSNIKPTLIQSVLFPSVMETHTGSTTWMFTSMTCTPLWPFMALCHSSWPTTPSGPQESSGSMLLRPGWTSAPTQLERWVTFYNLLFFVTFSVSVKMNGKCCVFYHRFGVNPVVLCSRSLTSSYGTTCVSRSKRIVK